MSFKHFTLTVTKHARFYSHKNFPNHFSCVVILKWHSTQCDRTEAKKKSHKEISSTIKANFSQAIPLENEWCHFKRENKISANQIGFDAVNLQASDSVVVAAVDTISCQAAHCEGDFSVSSKRSGLMKHRPTAIASPKFYWKKKKKDGKFAWENGIERVFAWNECE